MAETIRMNKLLKFGVNVARDQALEKNFYSDAFKDSDYLNYIVSEWLHQNYTQDELFKMGYDEVLD